MLRTEKPLIPGNSVRRSLASCSTIDLPHVSPCCRSTINLPISQYRAISSLLTALRAAYWAERIRCLISPSSCPYSVTNSLTLFSLFLCLMISVNLYLLNPVNLIVLKSTKRNHQEAERKVISHCVSAIQYLQK